MGKILHRTNTPPSRSFDDSDTRPRRRWKARKIATERLIDKVCGMGRANREWPFEMPRRVQRRIVRQMLKLEHKPRELRPGYAGGLTDYQIEQKALRRKQNERLAQLW